MTLFELMLLNIYIIGLEIRLLRSRTFLGNQYVSKGKTGYGHYVNELGSGMRRNGMLCSRLNPAKVTERRSLNSYRHLELGSGQLDDITCSSHETALTKCILRNH